MQMKRSRAAVLVTGLAMTTALAACGGNGPGATNTTGDKTSGQTLTVYVSGDTNIQDLWTKTLGPDFKAKNPDVTVNVTFDLHGTNTQATLAKLAAATKQKKDAGIDITEGGLTSSAAPANLLVDPSTGVPNLKKVPAAVVKAGGAGAIPYRGSSVVLAYDSTKISDPPKTLDALLRWIKDNPGHFTYNSPKSGGSGGAFATTVLDSYVPAAARAQMTTGYHKDLEKYWDPGFAALKALNPYVYQKGVYPNGNNQTLDLLASGQIWMAPVWSDQFLSGQKSGQIPDRIKVTQISNPSFTGGAAYIGVTKVSKNPDLAMKFADFILTPPEQAKIAEQIAGYPVISIASLPASVKDQFSAVQPGNLRPGYFSDHGDDINNLWDQKVPGN
jgi:putative spermidine/putrescine transport system substrate-binding protein